MADNEQRLQARSQLRTIVSEELDRRGYTTREDVRTIVSEELDKRDFATKGDLQKEVGGLRGEMASHFRWLTGIILTAVGILLAGMGALGAFLKFFGS